MKLRGPLLLILGILLFLCVGRPCRAQEPYQISYSPGALIHALARDRLKVVYERAGLPVEFIPLPHRRSLVFANEGVVDGEAGRIAGIEKSYPNLRRVNVKLMDLIGTVYVMDDSSIDGYRAALLNTNRLGMVRGVLWVQKLIGDRHSEKVNTYKKLLEMLLEGRIDMVLASKVSADAVLQSDKERYRHIRALEPPAYSAPLYHYVHKKNEKIIPLLEKALRELRDEDYWGDAATANEVGNGCSSGQ